MLFQPIGMVRVRGIADAMTHQIGFATGCRQGGRRPNLTCFLVTNIEYFSRHIAYWVIAPAREPVFATVARPAITTATLTRQEAKAFVGDHIDPGSRGLVTSLQIDNI